MYHLKLVGRQIFQQKGYFAINAIGLAVALTASMFIYTFLAKEWQTNRYHEYGDHIYRITNQYDGNAYWGAEFCSSLGELAQAELPEVVDYTRIIAAREMKIRWEDDDHYQTGISCGYADRQLFRMFTFPLSAGSIQAFEQPGWIVISESIARRYFQDENPIGKLAYLENLYTRGSVSTFRIAGIMKDMPPRSSIQADVILDFSVIEHSFRYHTGNSVQTFIQLTDGADIHHVEEQLRRIEYRESDYIRERQEILQLQPLREMYLHSDHIQTYDLSFAQGSETFNRMLFGILLLILSLAFCNYLIIKLALANKNAERFAIQKYFGSSNRNVFVQVLLEIGIYSVAAFALTGVLTSILYPHFAQIISPRHPLPFYLNGREIVGFLLIFLLFSGSVGGITYWHIRRKLTSSRLKNTIVSSRSSLDLKKILMVVQLTIFCGLLFFSIVFLRQIDFLQNKPLGYNNRNTISFDWPNPHEITSLKEELSLHPDILAVSCGAPLPIGNWAHWDIHPTDQPERNIHSYSLLCDEDFLHTYQLKLVEGREARTKITTPEIYSRKPVEVVEVVVNQKFVQQMGLSHPIGTLLSDGSAKIQIVGIVQDFHYHSLHEPIQPVMIGSDLPGVSFTLIVRYREGKRGEIIHHLKQLHESRHPERLMHYQEYPYSELYEREIMLGRLVYIFTGIALLIGGMGVLAFSIFIAESKRKEIALRKVNGASEGQIMIYLNRIFTRQVAIACTAGITCSYLICRQWLQGFAYRVPISPWIIIHVIGVSLLLVVLITCRQIRRATRKKPIDSLKTE